MDAARPKGEAYERHKERSRVRQKEIGEETRDIGELPEVANPERRASCENNLQLFLETYFPNAFRLGWSDDHLQVVAAVQSAVRDGGQQIIAMPRGSGKTTICERAVIWAILYGHCRFGLLIAAGKEKAEKSLKKIKIELERNPLLLEDFPEAVVPIRALEGLANRCTGQLYQGERTYIGYSSSQLVFASIEGAKCSGAILNVGGLESAVRGANEALPNGEVIRPDLVLVDDPQTKKSARSDLQCQTREELVTNDLMGCVGPGESLSVLMTVTVIRRGDMADRMLNRQLFPDWRGIRCKMLYAMPVRMDLWEQYWQILADDLRDDGDGSVATEFYAANREEMDREAKVAWKDNYQKKKGELSGLQRAMNLFFKNRAMFFAEYQNEPEDEAFETRVVDADKLSVKLNGLKRGLVPARNHLMAGFIDVHEDLLYWSTIGWGDGFTGDIVDYGTFPPQSKTYFHKRDARPDMITWFAKEQGRSVDSVSLEEALYAALDACSRQMFEREWIREDGANLALRRILIDSSHGPTSDLTKTFCAESAFKELIWPSLGVGKTKRNMFKPTKSARKKGDRFGFKWRLSYSNRRANVAHLFFDANFWKTFLWGRLRVGMGGSGSLSFFGEWAARRAGGQAVPKIPDQHKLLIDHLRGESPKSENLDGDKIEIWYPVPNTENHFLDCLVGSCVAASFEGVTIAGHDAPDADKKPRKKFSMNKRGAA